MLKSPFPRIRRNHFATNCCMDGIPDFGFLKLVERDCMCSQRFGLNKFAAWLDDVELHKRTRIKISHSHWRFPQSRSP